MRIQNIKRFWNCYRVLQKIAKNWKWHGKTRFFDISHYAVTLNYTVTWKGQDFEWMRLKIQKMRLKRQLLTIKLRRDINSFPVSIGWLAVAIATVDRWSQIKSSLNGQFSVVDGWGRGEQHLQRELGLVLEGECIVGGRIFLLVFGCMMSVG